MNMITMPMIILRHRCVDLLLEVAPQHHHPQTFSTALHPVTAWVRFTRRADDRRPPYCRSFRLQDPQHHRRPSATEAVCRRRETWDRIDPPRRGPSPATEEEAPVDLNEVQNKWKGLRLRRLFGIVSWRVWSELRGKMIVLCKRFRASSVSILPQFHPSPRCIQRICAL